MVYIYGFNIKNINDELYNKSINSLTCEKRDKIERFKKKEDRLRSVGGNLLLKETGIDKYKFDYNSYGKPYIQGNPFYFNISHSGDYVLLVKGDREVGVDIEKKEKIEFNNIAKRFFNNYEYKAIKEAQEKNREDVFYEIWVLKESYIKNKGGGLSIPLSSFSITTNNGQIKTRNIDTNYNFRLISHDNKYKTAISSKSEEIADMIEFL